MPSNCSAGEDSWKIPWTARRSNQSILREINPEYSLEAPMLKLKLQYSGHLMRTANSLEKPLMLEKIEGRRRRGRQRMRGLDGITDASDMNLGKLCEMLRGREAWCAAVYGVTKSWTQLGNWIPCVLSQPCSKTVTASAFQIPNLETPNFLSRCLILTSKLLYNLALSLLKPSIVTVFRWLWIPVFLNLPWSFSLHPKCSLVPTSLPSQHLHLSKSQLSPAPSLNYLTMKCILNPLVKKCLTCKNIVHRPWGFYHGL